MTQQELYELAGKIDTKSVVYFVAAHLEQLQQAEFGGNIDCGGSIFTMIAKFEPKGGDK